VVAGINYDHQAGLRAKQPDTEATKEVAIFMIQSGGKKV
jgi:hypothetical protein